MTLRDGNLLQLQRLRTGGLAVLSLVWSEAAPGPLDRFLDHVRLGLDGVAAFRGRFGG